MTTAAQEPSGTAPPVPGHIPTDKAWDELSTAEKMEQVWADPPGVLGWFMALQNDRIGARIMATAFFFFILGGINALLMRVQLASPENTFLTAQRYNELFTMHGSTMMYLFAVPMMEGFAILLMPLILGNREMPFPRLGVFSWFTFLLGGLLFYSSFIAGAVPDTGWFAYVPLSGLEFSPDIALDYWLLALGVAEVAAIAAGVEIILAILRMRAPGMSLSRLPVYAWAMLVMAVSILFAFTPLIVSSLLLELDRRLGTQFFNPDAGGSPLLWQHLFWIFGHPEVYIQFIPAAGIISMVVPVFSRRSLAGYTWVVIALVSTGFLSFGLWVHHMFTVGLPQISMAFFAAASMIIGIPAGIQVIAWITTIFTGRPVFKTAFLFVIGFLVTFVLGGITGIMVGAVPFDWQVHDSYFVVAHFHYVLIGGVTFPVFAGIYYWTPKFTGRLLDERLGKLHFWLFFIGFNVAFFPMHISGLLGMVRRVYTYPADLGVGALNLTSTIGAFTIALGVAVFIYNFLYSRRRGEPAGNNPWNGDTLEWAVGSPAPNYGFAHLPIVRSRHPLWEQETIDEEDDVLGDTTNTERMLQALSEWPLRWRAALITGAIDGKPVEVFRVAGPSIWPAVAGIALVTIFGSEVFALHWLTIVGIVVFVAALIGWHWPDKIPFTEKERAFEEEFNIPVRPNGSVTIGRWGMALAILLLGIALASFLFAYFYIRLENPIWPPDNIPVPDLLLPAIATALLLLAGFVMGWAVNNVRNGNIPRLRLGLLLVFLLGAAALAVIVWEYTQLPFTWELNAYASLFYALGGYMMLLLVVALGMNLFVQVWAWRGHYTELDNAAVHNSAWFVYAVAVFWVITFGILYLAPRLT
ncbi:MAG: cytochrome c oxidase subunit I [Anaerolineae bacterium]|nr:cytochrome c oxidase subunit I [Anaerolineae bacterium]